MTRIVDTNSPYIFTLQRKVLYKLKENCGKISIKCAWLHLTDQVSVTHVC